jgi:putative peptide maturation dehydrogenase
VHLRRPHILLVQRREAKDFDLTDLLRGGAGVVSTSQWVALAPHLDQEVKIELDDLAILDALPGEGTIPRESLLASFDERRVDALIEAGLLRGEHEAHAAFRERDARLRATAWWAPAAVVQAFGRWLDVDVSANDEREGKLRLTDMINRHGPPPAAVQVLGPEDRRISLPPPKHSALDELLAARTTCRNFDEGFALPLPELASLLHRVFGAQAVKDLAPGVPMLKKNSPSGGGLHPIEAYLLVQRVDGLAPGLYHYLCDSHALEPLRLFASAQEGAVLAHELVAGQDWFANAPVLVLMAARFQRNFWKYQVHAKAWKVIQLDAGHLSQNFYLGATELGLGAFITAAINDRCAERVFDLDGLSTGAVAVCGLGRRADRGANIEFDPNGKAVR